jgi:SAM-dependent methyltransferase
MGEIVSTDTLNSGDTKITDTVEDRALKAKHAAMWASGSYPTVVDDVVAALGGVLVDTVDIRPDQRVLDVAAGTGTSSLPADRRGGQVTATDLTPELLEVGRALQVDRFTDGVESREFMKTSYGPTIAVCRYIADDLANSPPWTPIWPPWVTGT